MFRTITTLTLATVLTIGLANCKKNSDSASDGAGSEISVGAIGGSASDGAANEGYASVPTYRENFAEKLARMAYFIPTANAFSISCTGGSISPAYTSSGYSGTWTPIGCSLTFLNGRSTSVTWTGDYQMTYSAACTGVTARLNTQPNNCVRTRKTSASGITRTLTGVNGNSLALQSNTTAPGGYDSSVTTSTGGNITTCTAASCASRTIALSGSRVTLTATPSGGSASTLWDHTYSTAASAPISISGIGTSKVVNSGTVVVQHNLAKFTSSTTIVTPLQYTSSDCCFPTVGQVKTTFSGGSFDGKSETVTFSSACGEATLVDSAGTSTSLTLQHCL